MEIVTSSAAEPFLNQYTLDRVKRFILAKGQRCTYSNMYNHNPCLRVADIQLYLNPDPGSRWTAAVEHQLRREARGLPHSGPQQRRLDRLHPDRFS
jgi:hypothetical protein